MFFAILINVNNNADRLDGPEIQAIGILLQTSNSFDILQKIFKQSRQINVLHVLRGEKFCAFRIGVYNKYC